MLKGSKKSMKKQIKSILFAGVALLTSCGDSGNVDGTIYVGDAFTKMNAVVLKYSLPKTLGGDARISGSISIQENTEVKGDYTLGYSATSPLSTTYTENILISFSKEQIQSTQGGVKYDLALNLNNVFPTKNDTSTVYFVIHSSDWIKSNPTTYGYTNFKYSWNDGKVALQLD